MSKKGTKCQKYSPEFKLSVILDMQTNHLGYRETARKYFSNIYPGSALLNIQRWERIYLEEGEAGLSIERRGRGTRMDNPKKGRPRKKPLDATIENDIITENQWLKEQVEYLRMENEYLKKLDALVQERMQREKKKQK